MTYFTARQRAGALLMHQTFLHSHRAHAIKTTGAITSETGKDYADAIDGVIRCAAEEGNLAELIRALLGLIFDVMPEMVTKYEDIAAEVESCAYSAVDEHDNDA